MRRVSSILALCLLVASCNRGPGRVVGVVPKGANHLFWQTVHAGAIAASRESKIRIEWNAPALEIDAGRQISILDAMINKRVAGIAVAPVDRQALVAPIERAARAGIPVAIFDSDVDSRQRLTYVATDNVKGGRMAARKLGEILLGKGKLAYIGFMPGSAATMEREQGFEQELHEKFPDMHIVQKVYGMANRAGAMASTENIMQAHPDLDGLFADNESSSMGAVLALKARQNYRVRAVVFDANEHLIDDLRDRYIDGIVVQNPFKMGYESVKAIAMKLKGETPPEHIDSGVVLVSRPDLEKPDIIPLLYPDIKKYLEPY